MANFGETLFGKSPFIRWSLTPVVLIFAVFMPLLIEVSTPLRLMIMVVLELMCLALLAGFWLPARLGRYGFRIVAASVFLCYVEYLIYEFFFSETPFKIFESRGAASPRNALLGFAAFGLPSLWYALFGRFTFRPSKPINDDSDAAAEDREA